MKITPKAQGFIDLELSPEEYDVLSSFIFRCVNYPHEPALMSTQETQLGDELKRAVQEFVNKTGHAPTS